MKYLVLLIALTGCASAPVENYDCRRTSQIMQDADYYEVCLAQKGLK